MGGRTVAFWGLGVGGARAGLGIVEGRFVAECDGLWHWVLGVAWV